MGDNLMHAAVVIDVPPLALVELDALLLLEVLAENERARSTTAQGAHGSTSDYIVSKNG
jgi:hypothetical protein